MTDKKKVGICTLFTGYNLGSALQAFAIKTIVGRAGYDASVIKLSGSLVSGRDIRLRKAIVTLSRMLLYSKNKLMVFRSFAENDKEGMNKQTVDEFDLFYKKRINPNFLTYRQLEILSRESDWHAFVCGSDQIWNSTAFYIDPFYYLDFAPFNKRIAYAPSFGRDYIPEYNRGKIAKYLSRIDYLSVREKTGVKLINDLTKKRACVCLDPTLLLDREDWYKAIEFPKIEKDDYILCYFLNQPSKKAQSFIDKLAKQTNLETIYINKGYGGKAVNCGPEKFLSYIDSAKYVITDSYHGVAFSLNFQKQFFVFDRQYLTDNQSTRVVSLLDLVNLLSIFDNANDLNSAKKDYSLIAEIIREERAKSLLYLKNSLDGVYDEK